MVESLKANRVAPRDLLEHHFTCNDQMEKRRLLSHSKDKLAGAVLPVLR
jgi:hypothetical protein